MFVKPKHLRKRDACKGSYKKFRRLFPKGVKITKKICVKHCEDFDWGWAADNLLKKKGQDKYWKKIDKSYNLSGLDYYKTLAKIFAKMAKKQKGVFRAVDV